MVTLAVVADLHVDFLRKDNRDALIFNLAKLERQEAWDYLIIGLRMKIHGPSTSSIETTPNA